MTGEYLLTSVTKPSETELEEAILCFVDDKSEKSGTEAWKAAMAIIGEACSLLDDGKTIADVINSLADQGLSEECSTPLVEKANEIVQSSNSVDANTEDQRGRGAYAVLKLGIVTGVVLAFLVLAYLQ